MDVLDDNASDEPLVAITATDTITNPYHECF